MNELTDRIRIAQRDAGEAAVLAGLDRMGLGIKSEPGQEMTPVCDHAAWKMVHFVKDVFTFECVNCTATIYARAIPAEPEPPAEPQEDELQKIRDAIAEMASIQCQMLKRPTGYDMEAVRRKWAENIKTACAGAGIELGQ